MSDILNKFAPRKMRLKLRMPDSPTAVLQEIVLPTAWTWYEIGTQIIDPPPPLTKLDAATHTKSANPQDPEYVRTLEHNALLRGLMRVASAIEGAGETIPGETLRQKAEAMSGSWSIVAQRAFVDALTRIVNTKAEVVADAEATFQLDGLGADADDAGEAE